MSAAEQLIAVATTDGKTVHQHFGHVERFHIVAIGDTSYRYLEARDAPPACNNFTHGEHSFDAVWRTIADCKAVVVGKIGYPAAAYLIGNGMRVFETVGMVDEILSQIVSERLLNKE
ncbi:MAG: dinitrogenase iron-molybdenum cofactor biosynthesis protein [Clostridiales bacterium]|jgi:predicted Fe-Mo cluster-binding NifX family protein|nr:dinitrogenase iron-molybdenum cofactor biosynthesis protein [Clostridiales bacterium]